MVHDASAAIADSPRLRVKRKSRVLLPRFTRYTSLEHAFE